jgi:hypothetical protein
MMCGWYIRCDSFLSFIIQQQPQVQFRYRNPLWFCMGVELGL